MNEAVPQQTGDTKAEIQRWSKEIEFLRSQIRSLESQLQIAEQKFQLACRAHAALK